MVNELTHTQMVEILEYIRDNAERDLMHSRASGICQAARRVALDRLRTTAYLPDSITQAFSEWPEFSGNWWYPVPPLGSDDPDESAASMYNRVADVWDRGTEYGRARWRLLDFLIEWYKTQPPLPETLEPPYPLEGNTDKPATDEVF